MISRFAECLVPVLVHEGGNDNDPDDPGGRTSRGITQREYDAYCDLHGFERADVWRAPQPLIEEIYHTQYWLPWCPTMTPGVDYLLFDCSVLHGFHRAVVWLQRALGVAPDGHIGILTRQALAAADTQKVIVQMSRIRQGFIRQLRLFWKYGDGWIRRANEVKALALKMAEEHKDGLQLGTVTS